MGCETLGSRDQNRTVFRLEENPRGGGGESRYGYRGNRSKKKAASRTQTAAAGQDEGEPDDVLAGGTQILDSADGAPVDEAAVDGTTTTAVDPKVPASKPPVAASTPFANPVPGKFGHVYSPFAKGKEVDVSGYPPGAEVRCPYTQNIFKVP